MPDLEMATDAVCDDESGGIEGFSRHRHRVRELAVGTMVEATAKARMDRAANSKTRRPVEAEQYEIGDKVEVFRDPKGKELPGWRGDGEVLKMETDGAIIVKWMGGSPTCRPQDVRRALLYPCFLALLGHANLDASATTPFDVVRNHTMTLTRTQELYTINRVAGTYSLSRPATKNPMILHAILHMASCGLHLAGCTGGRLLAGLPRTEGVAGYDDSVIWCNQVETMM